MGAELDKVFRVQITERRSGVTYDLQVTGLRYELGLPGGFKTCNFTAPAKDSSNVYYLDDVKVFYSDDIVWEGQVEEINAAGFATEFICLGYAVALKNQPLGLLFIDRAFDRWKDAKSVYQGYADGTRGSFEAPVFNVTDGVCAQALIPAGTLIADGMVSTEWNGGVYVPPWGAFIRAMSVTVRTHYLNIGDMSGGNTTWDADWAFSTNDTVNQPGTTLTQTFNAVLWINGGSPTADVAFPLNIPINTPYRFARFRQKMSFDTTGGGAVDEHTLFDFYTRFYNQVILGELHPEATTTPLAADQMMIDVMVRSMLVNRVQNLSKIRTSNEAMTPGRYVFQQAVFDETVPEVVIQKLCDVVGWEWGVFEGGLLHIGPAETVTALGYRAEEVFDAPPWYLSLRVEDGHDIDVRESMAAVVNQVQTVGVGQNGIRNETIFSNFNDARCPFNRPGSTPLEVRSRVLPVPSGFGATDVAVYAAAHLNRFAAPLVTGQVTISLPKVQRIDMGTTTPFIIGVSEIGGPDTFGGRPMEFQTSIDSARIRPGYWCHFPELETTLDDPVTNADSGMTRRPTGGMAMIRYVVVEAGDAGATVTLTLDDGSTRFDTALAQFSEARAGG